MTRRGESCGGSSDARGGTAAKAAAAAQTPAAEPRRKLRRQLRRPRRNRGESCGGSLDARGGSRGESCGSSSDAAAAAQTRAAERAALRFRTSHVSARVGSIQAAPWEVHTIPINSTMRGALVFIKVAIRKHNV